MKSVSIVFSAADIFRIIGPNSARFVGMADQIGSLDSTDPHLEGLAANGFGFGGVPDEVSRRQGPKR